VYGSRHGLHRRYYLTLLFYKKSRDLLELLRLDKFFCSALGTLVVLDNFGSADPSVHFNRRLFFNPLLYFTSCNHHGGGELLSVVKSGVSSLFMIGDIFHGRRMTVMRMRVTIIPKRIEMMDLRYQSCGRRKGTILHYSSLDWNKIMTTIMSLTMIVVVVGVEFDVGPPVTSQNCQWFSYTG
jgi:hypothetical protein